MITPLFSYRDAWAKTDSGQVTMRLSTHCQITGAVGQTLAARDGYLWATSLPILAACHDVGKMSAPFLSKSTIWMSAFGLSDCVERWARSGIRHEAFTQATVAEILEDRGVSTLAARILGAHHGRWLANDPGEIDLKECRAFFKSNRRQLVHELESEFGPLPQGKLSDTQSRYLAGAVAVCDWIASNPEFIPYGDDYPPELRERLSEEAIARIGLIPAPLASGLTFEEIFGFSPNTMQWEVSQLPLDRGLYLIEADTGSGKTESALFLAYRLISIGAARGLYFALPTQVSSNLIFRRVQKALRRFSQSRHRVRLCHGSAWLEQRYYRPMEGTEDGFAWFSSSRRGLLYPFGAGTVDQALLSTLKSVRHSGVRTFGIAGKVVIIDEAHSYDRYTGTLVEKLALQCKELKSPLIILSATLPVATKERLCSIFGPDFPPLSLNFATAAAPQKRVQLAWIDVVSMAELAIQEAQRGQCVMIVRNTVALSQQTYRDIQVRIGDASGVELGLTHSRFLQRHRRQHERYWTKALGKIGNRPSSAILVGTQILEQSLDIDADVLITDLCPIDMVIQRIGRLWRHQRGSRIGVPTVHIITPADSDFGPHGFVYSPYLLTRSRDTLEAYETLQLPAQTPELIEAVYAERDETDPLLQQLKGELETQVLNAINRATRVTDDRVDYDDEEATLTRLIAQETVDVVIHNGVESIKGGLRLHFGDETVDAIPDELTAPVGRKLHLNSLKIPAYHIINQPFEPALRRYFPGGVKMARLIAGRMEFPNVPGPFTYTSELGFESTK